MPVTAPAPASAQDVLGWSASLTASQGPQCQARPGHALLVVLPRRTLTPSRRQVWVGIFRFSVAFPTALFLKRCTWGALGVKGRCSAQNVPVERTQGAQDSWHLGRCLCAASHGRDGERRASRKGPHPGVSRGQGACFSCSQQRLPPGSSFMCPEAGWPARPGRCRRRAPRGMGLVDHTLSPKSCSLGGVPRKAGWEEPSNACVLNKKCLCDVLFTAFGKVARQERPGQGPAGRKDPCSVTTPIPAGFTEELWSVHRWFWVEEEGGQQHKASRRTFCLGAGRRLPKGTGWPAAAETPGRGAGSPTRPGVSGTLLVFKLGVSCLGEPMVGHHGCPGAG